MALPNLSKEERDAALLKAAHNRKIRAQLRESLKNGELKINEAISQIKENEAIAKMKRALEEFYIEGVKTTIPFHRQLLENEDFLAGNYTTKFMEDFNKTELGLNISRMISKRIPKMISKMMYNRYGQ